MASSPATWMGPDWYAGTLAKAKRNRSVPGQTGGPGTVAMPDVENYVSQYERGLTPYYQMAGQRYKQAIQRQLGQGQRQLGEQFQSRGLYGTGLYGKGMTNLYGQAMQQQAQGAGDIEMQRLQQVASRRQALQDMLYGSQESERCRQWQGYQNELNRLLQWKMLREQMKNQPGTDYFGPAMALLGTGVGAYFGGPAGAAAGASVGSSVGSSARRT